MILSALSAKGPLAPDVTSAALTALVCKPCQSGLEPSLLCALALVQVMEPYYLVMKGRGFEQCVPIMMALGFREQGLRDMFVTLRMF